jgi:hypothetical protein
LMSIATLLYKSLTGSKRSNSSNRSSRREIL